MSSIASRLELFKLFTEKRATIAIVGLGYVGMPLALAVSAAGFRVIGFDIDPVKVDAINAGESYIKHIPGAKIAAAVRDNRLRATTNFSDLVLVNAIVICVPTPLTAHREPDLTYVVGTAQAIAPHVQQGQVIVLKFDDLAGHHSRGGEADSRRRWSQERTGFLPRLFAGARRSGQSKFFYPIDSESGGRR